MEILFDNIIFSLQNSGGISVLWYELIKRILHDEDFTSKFINIPNLNIFGKQLEISQSSILHKTQSRYPLSIQRYINPKIRYAQGIFHSSYYRIVNNPNMVNITTVHDFTYEYFRKGLPKIIHHQQKGNAIKNSKRIICISNNTKKDLLAFYPEVDEKQIAVIYNGVSELYHPLPKDEINASDPLVPFQSGEFALYVGERKSAYKNFQVSVEACGIAKLPLVVVGGGSLTSQEDYFLDQILGSNNHIQLSNISNLQLNQLYNQAAFLIYPSLYEGFGIPIIEAQKAGCPVLCSNKSSIPEIAGKGACIINEITASKIAEVLKINKSRTAFTDTIVQEGFLNARRFSWDNCYKQTKKVYLEVYAEYSPE